MSASQMARQATSHQSIPVRRVTVNHEHEMPSDYGTTPGGTVFTHTPGGTRIVYDRAFLMHLRSSPLARTPPTNLPHIPGITLSTSPDGKTEKPCQRPGTASTTDHHSPTKLTTVKESAKEGDPHQFDIDI